MVRYCKNCGSELKEDSVFCDECGTRAGESGPVNSGVFQSYNIDMMDGEFVIRQSQVHLGCLLLPAIVLVIGVFFTILIAPLISLIIMVVCLIWLIIRLIGYITNDLILTNKRVFGKCGLISTTQMQSPLNRIDSVSYSNGLMGKLIGYGTVKIATPSTTFKFRFISDGQTLYNDIFNQLEDSEVENRNLNAKAIVDAMAEKLS
ncbi:PH domain-containing protein [uncultured Methanobrevibacter sp.]|uniref:PH domain-containing protein n=1 Tax=uncultured Methanobrevibacter sp. TaxID=253161 RepID=UPI0026021801|nr:PH domain-containing protein [uncultured Methanobrevibacter sp.]